MNALVIIDVQNDFMPDGSLGVPEGDDIVRVINSIQDCFDLVIATQDWHPHDHVSFASNHHGKAVFEKIDLDGVGQTLWPDHCVQGTKGAGFHPDLETHRFAAIFRKGMNPGVDSYSGFYDNNHQVSTGLAGYLREKGVTKAYFCGLASDICVYYSIKDALAEGFPSVFIEDASKPLNKESFEDQKKELAGLGVRIISSSDFF
ncbi:MAG TPA: bifunctional nicotinamidase/pyrazinamidase [Bacteroidales bacterium]|nr:bifunctional nicotinamidase/pyrazinamidase [Bacteroidales bacterium]HNR40643.1 bifunctional nicotinamidase/pyrazinamidase [Bacteroidales bacterium]HQG77261.1 bifunctional nicotinamidase/pyrazinamidase [Bacteroidales bacterium]